MALYWAVGNSRDMVQLNKFLILIGVIFSYVV